MGVRDNKQLEKYTREKLEQIAISSSRKDVTDFGVFLVLFDKVSRQKDEDSKKVAEKIAKHVLDYSGDGVNLFNHILENAGALSNNVKAQNRLLKNAYQLLRQFPKVADDGKYIGHLVNIPVGDHNRDDYARLFEILESNRVEFHNESELNHIFKKVVSTTEHYTAMLSKNSHFFQFLAENMKESHLSSTSRKYAQDNIAYLLHADDYNPDLKENVSDVIEGLVSIVDYHSIYNFDRSQAGSKNIFYHLIAKKEYGAVKNAVSKIKTPEQATEVLNDLIDMSIYVDEYGKVTKIDKNIWHDPEMDFIIKDLVSKGAEIGIAFKNLGEHRKVANHAGRAAIVNDLSLIIKKISPPVLQEYDENIVHVFSKDEPTKQEFRAVFARVADPLKYRYGGERLFNYVASENYPDALDEFLNMPEVVSVKSLEKISGEKNFMITALSNPVDNFILLSDRFPNEVVRDYQNNNTLAHYAAQRSEYADHLVSLVQRDDRFLDVKNLRGENMLHVMARKGNLRGFQRLSEEISNSYLLDSLSATDSRGRTALDLSILNNHADVSSFLRAMGLRTKLDIKNESERRAIVIQEANAAKQVEVSEVEKIPEVITKKPVIEKTEIVVEEVAPKEVVRVVNAETESSNIKLKKVKPYKPNIKAESDIADYYQGIFAFSFVMATATALLFGFNVFDVSSSLAAGVAAVSGIGAFASLIATTSIAANKEQKLLSKLETGKDKVSKFASVDEPEKEVNSNHREKHSSKQADKSWEKRVNDDRSENKDLGI